MSNIKAVIFDAGGVLHESNSAVTDDLVKELQLEQETLRQIWRKQIPLLGSGKIDEAEFWQQVKAEQGIRQVEVGENLLGRAFSEAFKPQIEVLELVRELGKQGLKLAVLSNTIEPHARAVRESGQFDGFDRTFLSHEIGMRKPDPAIYQYVLDELEVRPQEAIFIDDDKVNVEAAQALGINGIIYKSTKQLVAELHNFIPDVPLG
jgi:epoxide hydrolase-like predicted phosphatase